MSLKEESVFVPENEQISIELNVVKDLETKVEDVLPIFEEIIVGVKNITDKSLVDTFLDIIKTYDEKNTDPNYYFNKIGIQVNSDILDLTQKIINKTPTLLNEIENGVSEVIKDNKIQDDEAYRPASLLSGVSAE